MREPRIPTVPLHDVPAWAVLERRLFDATEEAWRLFSERYTGPDGRILHAGGFEHRDGVDDLYEPFFNWPAFYALGGSDEILHAAKRHFEGVTAQLTEADMLTGEYENGYDWFHQGESQLFFYNLCAADPGDERFAARARRFAELYTDPAHGNYDPARNIITAPHNGARGPLPGLGTEWLTYPASLDYMEAYGLPLHGLGGITRWSDLEDPAKARLMGDELQRRAAGDTAVNLAATSLVTNRWLYDGDAASAAWVARYVDGWRERAAAGSVPGGLMPDNVAPDGAVGGLHDGAWYGGHYGWTWPHGLHSVGMSTLIGAINASFVSGAVPGAVPGAGSRDDGPLDLVRTMLDTVLEHAITAPVTQTPFSLRGGWLERLGPHAAEPALLVPYRYGADGWFDYGPLQLDLPTWLWWWTRDDADRLRLDRVLEGTPGSTEVRPFRDKVEAGHEGPWLAFLDGRLPDYPERALSMALGQLARRVAVMDAEPVDPDTVHLHFWQRANPVVTEVLGQLITGTPQTLYNGGLPFAAVAYTDADRGRPGLPPDVAALVTSLDGGRAGEGRVELSLVNLSTTRSRRVRVRPSRFGEQRLVGVVVRDEDGGVYPGPSTAAAGVAGTPTSSTLRIDAADVLVELPPSHRADLVLLTSPAAAAPRHQPLHAEGA